MSTIDAAADVACTKCGKVQPRSEFYPNDLTLPPRPLCKGCWREYHRGRYQPKDGATDDPRPCEVCGKVYRPKQRKVSRFCSRACAERSEHRRDWRLRTDYGISAADYDALLAEQDGHCALCPKRPEDQTRYKRFLHVDHEHDTGLVRGLLCADCNLLLGRLERIGPVRIIDYLKGLRGIVYGG